MNKGTDRIVITGATGQQGGAIAQQLLDHGHAVRAVTRKPDSDAARALARAGAEVVAGDLDDTASLERALAGAWGLFAVQNTWEAGVEREEQQGRRLAEVAHRAGIQHLVYSSVGSAHRATGIPHFDNKWRVEEHLRSLGLPSHTILRPVFFMENLAGPWFLPGLEQGTLALGIGPETPLQMIAVEDIGRYGLAAFERHSQLNGRAIDIAGDSKTPRKIAEILSQATGRRIQHFQVPLEEVRKGSEDYARMLDWFERVGYEADIEGNAKEFGIRPTPFSEWVATSDLSSRARIAG